MINCAEQYDQLQLYFESFDPANIYWTIIISLWVEYLFELYLCHRQRLVYLNSKDKIPQELQDKLSLGDFEKSRLYGLDKNEFTIFSEFYGVVVLMVLLHFKGLYHGWLLTAPMLSWYPFYPSSWDTEIGRSIMFSMLAIIFNNIIGLPLSYYSTFYLEERHGLNNQTKSFFRKDFVKKIIFSMIITSPIVGLIVKIVQAGGSYFFVWLWLFCFLILMICLTIYPLIFNKTRPLEEGLLKERLAALAKSVNFPPTQIYVAENGKGAWSEGIFNKQRIMLSSQYFERSSEFPYEKNYSDLEVEAMVGHCLGYWKLNHVTKNMVISQVNLFLIFVVVAFFHKNHAIFRAFGFPNDSSQETPVLLGMIIILQFLLQIYNTAIGYVMNVLSRLFAFQADEFAVRLGLGEHLKSMLIKYEKDSIGFPVADPLYSAWHNSHPKLLQRIAAIDQMIKDTI